MLFPRPGIYRALLLSAFFATIRCVAPAAIPPAIDYNRDIQPILAENCYHCHGPDAPARKGKLRLDRHEGALLGGGSGYPSIVPGKSDDSELIARIFSTDPEEVMPSPESNRKLTAAQKDLLKRWVEEGAVWSEHWAFTAPVRPAIPASGSQLSTLSSQLSPNPIDAFILAKLARENVAPSPELSLIHI